VTLGGRRGTSGAQQLCESMEKVRAAGIWERRAWRGRGVVLTGKGRMVALRHDFIEERVALVPEGGGGHHRRWREGGVLRRG
jgi:hypothetical protein